MKEPNQPPASPAASEAPPVARPPASERVLAWIARHRKAVSWVVGVAVVAGALLGWNVVSTRRSEAAARESLQQARLALDARNFALAGSELSRIRENYAGTKAAEEATLLLARARLLQGQPEQAVALLQDFAPGASASYRPQAYGMLGAAFENMGRFADAAGAYGEAAAAATLPFFKAQLLADAGRTWAIAGDTSRAIGAYRRIVAELGATAQALEATVRLGELTRGDTVPR
jgi:tetratricopeptide (TPR) repeat protein